MNENREDNLSATCFHKRDEADSGPNLNELLHPNQTQGEGGGRRERRKERKERRKSGQMDGQINRKRTEGGHKVE